jgi:OmcA/MtrC family decaheme c-type cytochrome
MQAGRLRIAALVAGVMAASPAFAFTITVNSKIAAYQDTLVPAVGTVAPAAGSAQTFSDDGTFAVPSAFACASNATADCVKYAPADAVVTLQPTLGANTTFVSWSGCNSVSAGVCTVKVTGNRIVTANFKPTTYQVSAATTPVGTGTWTPPYGGRLQAGAIDCQTGSATSGPCVGTAPSGAPVLFTAVPAAGSVVTRWAGCTPVDADPAVAGVQYGNQCTLTTFGPTAVSVAFGGAANGQKLVTVRVYGAGVVTAADVNCTNNPDTSDCTAVVDSPGSKTFTAVPDAGSSLIAWRGCTSSTGNSCTVTNPATNVTIIAEFKTASGCLATSCHGAPHGGNAPATCGDCHPAGYTSSTVDTAFHINGTLDVNAGMTALKPAALPNNGAKIEITGVTVAEGVAPTVTFTITDPRTNAPLGIAAFGSGLSVTLSKLKADGTYESYYSTNKAGASYIDPVTKLPKTPTLATATQASSQTISTTAGARLVDNGSGSYTYTFNAPVTGVNAAQQHTVAIWGTRAVSGYNFRANAFKDFAPNGSAVVTREVVSDAACNACHGQLSLHGSRTGVKSCLTCHSPQTTDPETGNTVDMATMIHKIHNGALLTNGYAIVGYGQSYLDFSHVAMAPSHSGYFEGGGTFVTSHDPGLSRECGICHQGAQAANAFSKPSGRACTSCHDTVNPYTSVNHNGEEPQPTDDSTCATCHSATNVKRYHSRFFDPASNTNFATLTSPAFPANGHKFEATLVDVTADATGKPTWTVDFKLDGAAFDIKNMGTAFRWATCAFQIAGPTTDYSVGTATGTQPVGGTAQSCTTLASWVATGTPGRFTYSAGTFFASKPTGYYTASFEIMIQRVVGDATNFLRKPFSANPNFLTVKRSDDKTAVVVTGAEQALNARRAVVSFDKCNSCHVDLGFHSNRGRKGPDYCATCHNPKLDNGQRARVKVADAFTLTTPAGAKTVYLPESVSLNVFIHRIHMGKNLPSVALKELKTGGAAAAASPLVPKQGEILFGATRSAVTGVVTNGVEGAPELADFTEFAMPNPMNRCDQCHIDGAAAKTWALPEKPNLASVERTYRICNSITPAWATEAWCDATNASSNGMPKLKRDGTADTTTVRDLNALWTVSIPPLKAVCTSCHDSAATNAHADLYTASPMTTNAVEYCASCHGAGKTFDSLAVHKTMPVAFP